jgi:hypothetical protein
VTARRLSRVDARTHKHYLRQPQPNLLKPEI